MSHVNRRNFTKLTAAAFGGLVAGAGAKAFGADENEEGEEGAAKVTVDPALLLSEPNVCRGLSICKGHANGGENACAGQGKCAMAEAHTCKGQNACKGQGGCGAYPGQNTCEGKGYCAVPLKEANWKIARYQFKQLMEEAGKKVGAAPKE